MGLNEDIIKILDDFGTSLKEDLQQSLRDKKVTAGGQDSRLSKSIKFNISQSGDAISFKLTMPEYGEAVDKGRRAAGVSQEGQNSIAKWGKSRGYVGKLADRTLARRVQDQDRAKNRNKNRKKWVKPKKPSFDKQLKAFVYVVSRKLKEHGYKGNHFYSEVVDDGRLDKLVQDLTEVLKDKISIEIIDLTKV